ncbi:hypothetical protein BDF19DRAFT_441900 [Syncephalis fuscata]|nr:hypothetical protein BDF19DRAFT_441900 [Syncephalis fuscata]
MGTTQNLVNNDMDWRHNATRLWGIPLHPSGETYSYDFLITTSNDRHDAQARLFIVYAQVIINIFIAIMFVPNFVISIRMVINRPYSLSGCCCLIPALAAIFWYIFIVLYLFQILNCREIVWYTIAAFTVSSVANSMLVLQKAYIVFLKQRWILAVGVLFILPQLGFMPFSIKSIYANFEKDNGCIVHYSTSMSLYWFGVTIPVNTFFSGIFSCIAYQHYKKFGSAAWKRLAHNGIKTMCLVVFCNIMCAVCVLFELGGLYSQMFFIIDWFTTSTILVNHCSVLKKRITFSHYLT